MIEYWKNNDFCILKEKMMPIQIKDQNAIGNAEELLIEKEACISFSLDHCAEFQQKGAFVVLDFGKELCGGIRIVARNAEGIANFRITFGESLT